MEALESEVEGFDFVGGAGVGFLVGTCTDASSGLTGLACFDITRPTSCRSEEVVLLCFVEMVDGVFLAEDATDKDELPQIGSLGDLNFLEATEAKYLLMVLEETVFLEDIFFVRVDRKSGGKTTCDLVLRLCFFLGGEETRTSA